MQIIARTLIIFLIITLDLQAKAENHLVYFGGGKSNNLPNDDMFDASLKQSLAYGKASGWNSEYHFRKELPPGLSSEDKGKVKNDFSPKIFNDKIKELTLAIKNGKIKRGEQLLVYIDTHGDIKDGNLTGRTDSGDVGLEKLKFLISAAEKKGVKLGIVGATCYSGSLMKYHSPNTCLITTAQPDKVSHTEDGRVLGIFNPQKNLGTTNLEERYLEIRENTNAMKRSDNMAPPSQPMISTNAGIATDELLSPLKNSIVHDENRIAVYEKSICENPVLTEAKLDRAFRDTKVIINGSIHASEEEALPLLKEKLAHFDTLQNQLVAYNAAKNENTCTWPAAKNGNGLNLDATICIKAGEIDNYVSKYNSAKDENPIKEDPYTKRILTLQESNAYKNFKRLESENKGTLDKLNDLSWEISRIERQAYTQAYKKVSEQDKEPNPCRDFKL